MKLLFIIDNLGSGGAQRQMVTLARNLQSRGHHIEIFTYYPSDHYRSLLEESKISLHFYPKTFRLSLGPIVALRRLIRKGRFDGVLSFLDTPNFYAEMATIGIKTILVVSERFMYPLGRLPLKLRILQECHRFASYITVNSNHQRVRMESEFLWMRRKIRTIYNGLDLEKFKPISLAWQGENKIKLLVISSVASKKNSLNLARALFICREKYKLNVFIDWIGIHHTSGQGTMPMEQTSSYLNEKGIHDRWNWLGERSDIPQMIATHHALIHPSFFEGLPNVVCEALACGRPVLVSNVCDHPLLVQDGVTGYLFDPNSAEGIANAIVKFSRLNFTEMEIMGKAARIFAENILSEKRFVDEYEELFENLISSSIEK